MPDTILASDLGKYKCVACAYDRATAADFRTVATSRAEVERLIRAARPAVVAIEACSLAGWVHDLCGGLGVRCKLANTAAEAWKYKHTKLKTDRDDALRLTQLEALGQLPEVVVPEKRVREWRALIAHRQALVTQRVAAQNRIRAVLVGQGLPAPRGARAWTAAGLAGIAQYARPLTPTIAGRVHTSPESTPAAGSPPAAGANSPETVTTAAGRAGQEHGCGVTVYPPGGAAVISNP